MNAILTLKGRADRMATSEPSLAEQARRLELFEIAQLREQIGELEDRLEATEEQLESDRQGWNYAEAQLEKQLQDREACYQELLSDVHRLAVSKDLLQRDLDNALQANRELETKVKQMRELDPAGTRKRLQRVKVESANRSLAIAELRTNNKELTTENRKLKAALDEAIAAANSSRQQEPLRVLELPRLGCWQLFTCEEDGFYQVYDTENEVTRTVRIEGGEMTQPKLRPVPKAISEWVVGVHQEFFGGAK